MNLRLNSLLDLSAAENYSAILSKSHSITYNELENLSLEYADSISKYVNKQYYIGLFIDKSLEFIISVLSLWKLGTVPVLLNLLATNEELIKIIDSSGIYTIISTDSYLQKLENIKSDYSKDFSILQCTSDTLANRKESNKKAIIRESALDININSEAVVIFTSGATGEPKGVVHTFQSLLGSINNGNEILNHQSGDRWLASLPFYHIGGFQIICRALFYKASIIIPNSLHTEAISEAITEFRPTHASFVSTQLKRLTDNKVKPNIELQCTLIGGGFINKKLLLDAKESGWHPVKVYGSSETASFVCALGEIDVELKGDSAGKAVGSNHITIVDENGTECSSNTEGEIVIKSDSLFKYYLNSESETKNKLKQESYFTGDLGYIDDEGFLFVTGRKNEMIVTGGKNVNPIEVEKVILKFPDIVEAAVFPIDDIEWGEIVCAAIVASVKVDTEDLINFLKKELSSYKVPKKIFIEDAFPKTSLGKVERIKLKAKYNSKW